MLLETFQPRRESVSLPVNPELMTQRKKQNKLPQGNRKQIDSPDQNKLSSPDTFLLLLPAFKKESPTFIQAVQFFLPACVILWQLRHKEKKK